MILSELREYLQIHRRVALKDMAYRFDMDPEAIRGMLNKWIVKGKVVKFIDEAPSCASGCGKCENCQDEIYQWIDENQTLGN